MSNILQHMYSSTKEFDQVSVYFDETRIYFSYEMNNRENELITTESTEARDKALAEIHDRFMAEEYEQIVTGKDIGMLNVVINMMMDKMEGKELPEPKPKKLTKTEKLHEKLREKYEEMDAAEISKKYFSTANNKVVPQITKAIGEAMDVFRQKYDADGSHEICIVTDFENNSLVFIYGDGEDESDRFHTVVLDKAMAECFVMLEYMESPGLDQAVADMFTDAIHGKELFEGLNITVLGNYDYGQSEWDPFYES